MRSSNLSLTSFLAFFLKAGSRKQSLLTKDFSRATSIEYLVGIMWLKLQTLTKGFTLLRLAIFFLPIFFGYFKRVSVDARDEGMSVGAIGSTFVIVLNDDGFATSKTTVQHQNYLSRLQEFSHDCCLCIAFTSFKLSYFKQIETT